MSLVRGLLNRKGVYLPKEFLKKKFGKLYPKFLEKITVTYINFNGCIYSIPVYEEFSTVLLLPRHVGTNFIGVFPIANELKKIVKLDTLVKCDFTPYPNQQVVLDHLQNNVYSKENIDNGKSGCVLKVPTGYGKTFIAMEMIRYFNTKTLYIVPTTLLLEQAYDVFTKFLNIKIGRYYSNKKTDGDVVIITIASANLDKINKELAEDYLDKFGFIIFDEAHKFCTHTRTKVFKKISTPLLLGLSATIDEERPDGAHIIPPMYLGKILDAEKLEKWSKDNIIFKTRVDIVKYYGRHRFTQIIKNSLDRIDFCKTINMITRDKLRNKIICKYVRELYLQEHKIFIFTDRKEHCIDIYNDLVHGLNIDYITWSKYLNIFKSEKQKDCRYINKIIHSYCYPHKYNMTIINGDTDKDKIVEYQQKSDIIITTYDTSKTGVSLDKMTALIIATPRKSGMTQLLGRIFRAGGDREKERRIVDIVDSEIPIKHQLFERMKSYKKITKNINYHTHSDKDKK